MRSIMITNNKLAEDAYKNVCKIVFTEGGIADVFKTVRDYIHKGYKLLSHPLSGSVKPGENPYKSVLISLSNGELDLDSLRIIENSLSALSKFQVKYKNLTSEMRLDFQKIDYSLISSAFCNNLH